MKGPEERAAHPSTHPPTHPSTCNWQGAVPAGQPPGRRAGARRAVELPRHRWGECGQPGTLACSSRRLASCIGSSQLATILPPCSACSRPPCCLLQRASCGAFPEVEAFLANPNPPLSDGFDATAEYVQGVPYKQTDGYRCVLDSIKVRAATFGGLGVRPQGSMAFGAWRRGVRARSQAAMPSARLPPCLLDCAAAGHRGELGPRVPRRQLQAGGEGCGGRQGPWLCGLRSRGWVGGLGGAATVSAPARLPPLCVASLLRAAGCLMECCCCMCAGLAC